jgi:ribosomal protein S18 acetylase RimI-like enzyme
VSPRIREVNYEDARDADAIIMVLDSYASDPVGGGRALASDVRERLVPSLRDHATSLVLLAELDGVAVGIAICFWGLSTFRARPLLNIHDLAVVPEYRGRGIGRALLSAAETRARENGCCKLTLEVQDDNRPARSLYQRFGFEDVVYGDTGPTRFLAKPLEG